MLTASATARALSWAVALTAAMADTQNARLEAWHPAFGQVRPQAGHIRVSAALRARVAHCPRVQHDVLSNRRLTGVGAITERLAGQDAYTLRCARQVIGAVEDMATWHACVVQMELSSATDNPIFPDHDGVLALLGGKFMGQQGALASDAPSNAIGALCKTLSGREKMSCAAFLPRQLPARTLKRLADAPPLWPAKASRRSRQRRLHHPQYCLKPIPGMQTT